MHTESLRSMHYEKGSTPHPLFPEPGPGRFHNFVPTPSVLLPCTPGFPPFRSSSLFLSREQLPSNRRKRFDYQHRLACWIDRSSSHDFINNRFSGGRSKKERNHPCFCVEPDGNLNNTRIIGNNNDERANYLYLRTFHFEKISTKLFA